MKKMILAAVTLGGLVFAGEMLTGHVFATYTEPGAAVAGTPVSGPNTATAGIPLVSNTKPQRPVKFVNVTLQGVWDGGQGLQYTGAAVRAWKFNPQLVCAFDGGPGCITNWDAGVTFAWSRYPALDLAYTTDSGTPYVQHGAGGLSFSAGLGAEFGNALAAPTLNGSRLYYTVETLTAADAGTMGNVRVLLEGVY